MARLGPNCSCEVDRRWIRFSRDVEVYGGVAKYRIHACTHIPPVRENTVAQQCSFCFFVVVAFVAVVVVLIIFLFCCYIGAVGDAVVIVALRTGSCVVLSRFNTAPPKNKKW